MNENESKRWRKKKWFKERSEKNMRKKVPKKERHNDQQTNQRGFVQWNQRNISRSNHIQHTHINSFGCLSICLVTAFACRDKVIFFFLFFFSSTSSSSSFISISLWIHLVNFNKNDHPNEILRHENHFSTIHLKFAWFSAFGVCMGCVFVCVFAYLLCELVSDYSVDV